MSQDQGMRPSPSPFSLDFGPLSEVLSIVRLHQQSGIDNQPQEPRQEGSESNQMQTNIEQGPIREVLAQTRQQDDRAHAGQSLATDHHVESLTAGQSPLPHLDRPFTSQSSQSILRHSQLPSALTSNGGSIQDPDVYGSQNISGDLTHEPESSRTNSTHRRPHRAWEHHTRYPLPYEPILLSAGSGSTRTRPALDHPQNTFSVSNSIRAHDQEHHRTSVCVHFHYHFSGFNVTFYKS